PSDPAGRPHRRTDGGETTPYRGTAMAWPVGTVVRGTRWRWLGRRVQVWRVGGTRGRGSPMLCPVTVARGSRRRRLRRGRTPVCRVGRRGRPVGGLRGRVSARVRPVGTVVRGTRWRWLGRRVQVWRVGGTRGRGSPMVRPAAATRGRRRKSVV